MKDILKKISVVWLLFAGFTLSTILIVSGIGYFVISRDYKRFDAEALRLREEYIARQRQQIKSEVEQALNFVEYNWATAEERLRTNLKDRTYEAFAVATNLYRVNQGRVSEPEIRNMIVEALRPISFNHGRGYFFATGLDGVEILFADRPELEGKSMLNTRDTLGAYVIRDMIELVRREGEGYYQYMWSKPQAYGEDFRKIAFVKYFAPFDCFIGTGEYLDDVEQDIRKEVLNRIGKIRFGKEGYVFVVSYDGVTLMNGAQPELIGKNIWEMADPNGVKVIQEERKAAEKAEGDFIEYLWEKPSLNEIRPKISFVKGFPQWQWMIGAGVYTDDIEPVIAAMEAAAKRQMWNDLYHLGFTLTVILVTALSICFCLSHYFKRQLDLFFRFFKEAATGGKPIAVEQIFLREFQLLGQSANRMLEEREKAEDAFRESEVRFQAAFRASPNAIAIKRQEDGVWIDVNQMTLDMFGYTREEVIGKSALGTKLLIDLRDRQEIAEALERDQIVKNSEVRFRRKDGSLIMASVSARALILKGEKHFLFVAEDITDRKRAEVTLRESEEQFKTMFEMASIGMAQVDVKTGRWLRVNRKMCEITGYSSEEMLAISVSEITHPDDRQRDLELFQSVVNGNSKNYRLEKRYLRKDGATVWVNVNMVVIRDVTGLPLRAMATIEDVTERKRAEEENARLQDQLFQAQKMESIGRLAGGVAHDFNNMLSIIMGYTEIALCAEGLTDDLRQSLNEVFNAGRRSTDLTRQLLAFARKQTAMPKVLDLNDTISGMLRMLRRLIGEDIDFRWMPGHDLWEVKIDPSQVDQILANLVVNARDAISGVGAIAMKTRNVIISDSNRAKTPEFIPGEYVLLTVSDTGAGMRREVCEKIFEPFFTTKEMGKGTGLGLSTVYGIVKQNDGFIYVASELDKGTTFKVYLPRFKKETEDIPSEQMVDKRPTGNETILLVEDDEAVLRLSRKILQNLGYTVFAAKSPIDAVHLVAGHPGDLDLLITDVVMPGMNGRELAEQLRAIRPNLRCLYMSGYTADVITHRGILDEGVNFIQKPFGSDGFAAKVRQVLDR